jgi:hypothetical protein
MHFHPAHLSLVLPLLTISAAAAPFSPEERALTVRELPAGIDFPGAFVMALEWTDQLDRNVLVLSESVEKRREPHVTSGPTEFVRHIVSHYAGNPLALKVREELSWFCSNPDRARRPLPPRLSDVDGDGVAEVVGALEVKCGTTMSTLSWALEGGVDLFGKPPEGKLSCGGGGRISSSVRSSPFEAHLRAIWPVAIGAKSTDNAPGKTDVARAREAYLAAPARHDRILGVIEDGLLWKDTSGERAFVRSTIRAKSEGTIRLLATLLRKKSNGWVVEQQVQDGEVGCVSYDNVARFEPRVLDLTDLDGDGTREVTFAYRLGCVSDVSPVTVNLVLLEGSAKHLVRGESWVGGSANDDCAPPRSLFFDDDPILRLLDALDPRGSRHFMSR